KHLPNYLSQPGGLGWRVPSGVVKNVPDCNDIETPPKAELDIHEMEKNLIMEALERAGNNRSEAADLLNMSRRTLQRKLKEMGMVRKHRKRISKS
ncbi:MAG: sigma-54-dependent Fis family transcriptional regulator, partial [Prosthecobacter sp.]|nr:sigma-54-dependent Fis family transcriptional regulator [Prosthecobacter sp.]